MPRIVDFQDIHHNANNHQNTIESINIDMVDTLYLAYIAPL